MKLLFTLMFYLPIFCFSQYPGQFSIGLTLTPEYSFRYLTSDVHPDFIIENRNKAEKNVYLINPTISLFYQQSERRAFETGLSYSVRSFTEYWDGFVSLQPDPSIPKSVTY